MKTFALLGLVMFVSACGGDTPAAPTAPVIAQIAGVWRGTGTTASVAGGECFAAAFQATVGSQGPITVAITQAGSTVNATLTSDSNGNNYVYSGAVGQSAVSLTGSSCSACNLIGARCPTGTAVRDIKLQTLSVTGTVNGTSLTGTQSETFNIFSAGTSSAVGTLTLVSSFALTRQ